MQIYRTVERVRRRAYSTLNHGLINLGIGRPSDSLIPVKELELASARYYASREAVGTMNYGSALGTDSFRQALADFLYRQTNERHDVECLALTGGNSIGLSMALQELLSRSQMVKLWCEDPTYFHMRSIFTTTGLQGAALRCDQEGLVVDLFEKRLKESGHHQMEHVLYTIPTHHNPTGVSLSETRKKQLVRLAQDYNIKFYSDEPYNLLTFHDEVLPHSFSCLSPDNILSFGSFSKIACPGLRCGWISSSKDNIQRYRSHGALVSGGGLNPMVSGILTLFMNDLDNGLDQHVAKVRQELGFRCTRMSSAIRESLMPLGVEFYEPGGGYFIWLKLPSAVDASELKKVAIEKGVDFITGKRCAVDPEADGHDSYIRLSFAFYEADVLTVGIGRLAEVIEYVSSKR